MLSVARTALCNQSGSSVLIFYANTNSRSVSSNAEVLRKIEFLNRIKRGNQMIGYVFLSIALLSGAVKGYCGKKLGTFALNQQSAVLLNMVRMALCIVFGFLIVLCGGGISAALPDGRLFFISAISGISTSVMVVAWLLSVRKSAYLMVDVFLTLGSLVPTIACFALFGEAISAKQWIGYTILIIAAFLMCSYNNSIKVKMDIPSLAVLIICGFSSGVTDFSQKWFIKEFPNLPAAVFNLYTYAFAGASLSIFYLIILKNEKPKFESGSGFRYLYVAIMAIMLFANSLFKTKAAVFLDSAQLYPITQGMGLILSSLMAAIFFKERLTVKCIIGMSVTFVGMLIMNGILF